MQLFIPFSAVFSAMSIVCSIVGLSPASLLMFVSVILADVSSSLFKTHKYFLDFEASSLCSTLIIRSLSAFLGAQLRGPYHRVLLLASVCPQLFGSQHLAMLSWKMKQFRGIGPMLDGVLHNVMKYTAQPIS